MKFNEFVMDDRLKIALSKQGITQPAGIQSQAFLPIRTGKDIIGRSETGTGKTLAYLLPIFERYQEPVKMNQVIILVPTHELAMQVYKQTQLLSENSGMSITAASIIGDVKIDRQIIKLKEKPQIIIGTPGRILELIKKRKIAAHHVKTIVIDEADKLLDKDNKEIVQAVIKCTLKDRQILLFSASMPERILDSMDGVLQDPVTVFAETKKRIPEGIRHISIQSERRDKIDAVRKYIQGAKPKKAMVFMNKASDIEELTHKLVYLGFSAECLHGSNIKRDRKRVVEQFRKNQIQILIATDIAARGLHFDDIDTILHVSIPENPTDYLHRVGRTGRNGKNGLSVVIADKDELKFIKKYENKFQIKVKPYVLSQGKVFDAEDLKKYKNRTTGGNIRRTGNKNKKVESKR